MFLASCLAACATFGPTAVRLASARMDAMRQAPDAGALREAIASGHATQTVAAFYRGRNFAPLWTTSAGARPEAYQAVQLIAEAADDGLDPARYRLGRLRAALGRTHDPAGRAALELALSVAYGRLAYDLQTPPPAARPDWVDPAFASGPGDPAQALAAAARAPSLAAHLQGLRPDNPAYVQTRAALKAYRAGHPAGGPGEALILANLERARALPRPGARRVIWVDAPARTLWLIEDGRVIDSMPVVVGKLRAPTPQMAGLARYAVYNPYWNVPPDLTRNTYAPQVLKGGTRALAAEGLEPMSDWTPAAVPLDPADVPWAAVARGEQKLRLRQKPGPNNMMGEVKLMLPNPLGIYLHDTPMKWAFAGDARALSNGCVRLQDAARLTRELLGPNAPPPSGEPEQRVELPEPIPVYITYLTVGVGSEGVVFRDDIYRRDPKLLAALRTDDGVKLASAGPRRLS